jgi:hypothetical protein
MGGIYKLQSLGHEESWQVGVVASSPAGAVSGSPAGWRVTVYRAFDPLVPEWVGPRARERATSSPRPSGCGSGGVLWRLRAPRARGGPGPWGTPGRIVPLRRWLGSGRSASPDSSGHGMGDLLGPIHARETDGPPLVERALLANPGRVGSVSSESAFRVARAGRGEPENRRSSGGKSNPVDSTFRLDRLGTSTFRPLDESSARVSRHDERRLTGHRVRFRVTRGSSRAPEGSRHRVRAPSRAMGRVQVLVRAARGVPHGDSPRSRSSAMAAASRCSRVDDRAVAARFDFEFRRRLPRLQRGP